MFYLNIQGGGEGVQHSLLDVCCDRVCCPPLHVMSRCPEGRKWEKRENWPLTDVFANDAEILRFVKKYGKSLQL